MTGHAVEVDVSARFQKRSSDFDFFYNPMAIPQDKRTIKFILFRIWLPKMFMRVEADFVSCEHE